MGSHRDRGRLTSLGLEQKQKMSGRRKRPVGQNSLQVHLSSSVVATLGADTIFHARVGILLRLFAWPGAYLQAALNTMIEIPPHSRSHLRAAWFAASSSRCAP